MEVLLDGVSITGFLELRPDEVTLAREAVHPCRPRFNACPALRHSPVLTTTTGRAYHAAQLARRVGGCPVQFLTRSRERAMRTRLTVVALLVLVLVGTARQPALADVVIPADNLRELQLNSAEQKLLARLGGAFP